jgi:hypothetical protein
MTDIDVETAGLHTFAGRQITVETTELAQASAGTGGSMPESQKFQQQNSEAIQKLSEYFDKVNQGLRAYHAGVGSIADLYDATEESVVSKMQSVVPMDRMPVYRPGTGGGTVEV